MIILLCISKYSSHLGAYYEKTYVPVAETPVFALEEVEAFEAARYAVQDNLVQDDNNKIDIS